MQNSKITHIIEDSRHRKTIFYFDNNSIYSKEISKSGHSKETMIINHVYGDYQVTIDSDDIVYLVCNSNDKGILLFTFDKGSWKFQSISGIMNSSSITLLKLFIIEKSIHVIYAKKLPIANFYTIYHIYSNKNKASTDLWKKNNINEAYSSDLRKSVASIMTKDNNLHVVNVWYDGTGYFLIYSFYDCINDIWSKKSITTLFNNNVSLKLLYNDNKLHLICDSFEERITNIFYFNRKLKNDIDFEFISLCPVSTNSEINPVFYFDDNKLYGEWFIKTTYCQMLYRENRKEWASNKEYSITNTDMLQLVEFIINYKGYGISSKMSYVMIGDDFNLSYPWEDNQNASNIIIKDEQRTAFGHGEAIDVPEITEFMTNILTEIKLLSLAIESLNKRMDKLTGTKADIIETKAIDSDKIPNEKKEYEPAKSFKLKNKSSFKEKFMNSTKPTGNPEATALFVGANSIPKINSNITVEKENNIEESIKNNINQYIAKAPENLSPPANAEQPFIDAGENENITGETSKQNNLIRKIGDLFK